MQPEHGQALAALIIAATLIVDHLLCAKRAKRHAKTPNTRQDVSS